MDLNFGVKISWWLLGKPKFCSNSQETAFCWLQQKTIQIVVMWEAEPLKPVELVEESES